VKVKLTDGADLHGGCYTVHEHRDQSCLMSL